MTKLPVEARLSATVVLLRDTEHGLETLLLRRNPKLAFAAGSWVFPGGAVDRIELESAPTERRATEIAAVREVQEECGVIVSADAPPCGGDTLVAIVTVIVAVISHITKVTSSTSTSASASASANASACKCR